jgi:hypothetical protein
LFAISVVRLSLRCVAALTEVKGNRTASAGRSVAPNTMAMSGMCAGWRENCRRDRKFVLGCASPPGVRLPVHMPEADAAVLWRREAIVAALRAIVPGEG